MFRLAEDIDSDFGDQVILLDLIRWHVDEVLMYAGPINSVRKTDIKFVFTYLCNFFLLKSAFCSIRLNDEIWEK